MSMDWEKGQEIKSNWMKFSAVGDQVIGRLENKRLQKGTGNFGDQWVYELLIKETGETVYVPIAVTKKGTIDRLNKCQLGEIIGIKREKDFESKVAGMRPAKTFAVKTFGMDPEYHQIPAGDGSDEELDSKEVPFN